MKLKSVRQAVSSVFDVLIPKDRWQDYMAMLDRDGHPNRREMIQLVLIFGTHIETLEQAVEELNFRLDSIEGKIPAKLPENISIYLRTLSDVKTDLEANLSPETKALYLPSDDFKIYETTVNPNEPETQFGKETDPKDHKEKTCLYYKEIPVFKQ